MRFPRSTASSAMSARLQTEAVESFGADSTTTVCSIRFHEQEWCRDLTDQQSAALETESPIQALSGSGAFVKLAPWLCHDSSRRQFARETLSFAGRSVRDSAHPAESWSFQVMIAMAGSAAAAQNVTVESARFEAKEILRAADAGARDLRLWLAFIEFEHQVNNHVRVGARTAHRAYCYKKVSPHAGGSASREPESARPRVPAAL